VNLVFLAHPEFLGLRSQAHFVRMLVTACQDRGHNVQVRQPGGALQHRVRGTAAAKWAGYADQYLLFPRELRRLALSDAADTLYVFCDQALGPWVPALAHRPHVVHCHDLLALRSALGEVAENPTRATGRLYQRFIRRGFMQARHFICISRKTQLDLHRLGGAGALTSEVVYNGLNHAYAPMPDARARQLLQEAGVPAPDGPWLLHVGGGQWYKNTPGVLALYGAYARAALQAPPATVLPLVVVGPDPTPPLAQAVANLPPGARVLFVGGLQPLALQALYARAAVLLFPSLAEGFGWPIVEAMACGCPVITTAEPPMNEVGGDVALYLPRLRDAQDMPDWSAAGAAVLQGLLNEDATRRQQRVTAALDRAARFSADGAIEAYLRIYERVLQDERPARRSAAPT